MSFMFNLDMMGDDVSVKKSKLSDDEEIQSGASYLAAVENVMGAASGSGEKLATKKKATKKGETSSNEKPAQKKKSANKAAGASGSGSIPSIVYQFKITLKGTKPPIWRRIQVPQKFSFLRLHRAVQSAMGWHDCHMHTFNIKDPHSFDRFTIGEKSRCDDGGGFGLFSMLNETKDEKCAPISRYFNMANKTATYMYDMGDGWSHSVTLEKIVLSDGGAYPRCIGGKRACPPEDCGGVYGYENLLAILADPSHEEHKERKRWIDDVGWEFEPEKFDSKSVCFF